MRESNFGVTAAILLVISVVFIICELGVGVVALLLSVLLALVLRRFVVSRHFCHRYVMLVYETYSTKARRASFVSDRGTIFGEREKLLHSPRLIQYIVS